MKRLHYLAVPVVTGWLAFVPPGSTQAQTSDNLGDRSKQPAASQPVPDADNTPRPAVYLLELTGEYKRDIALTPIKEVLKDVKKNRPDILIIKLDAAFTNRCGLGKPDALYQLDSLDQLELTRVLAKMLIDDVRSDAHWTPKPRLVFWVKKAVGGIALLPFIGKEIYYTSDARHGGIGYLDIPFKDADMLRPPGHGRSLRYERTVALAMRGDHPIEVLHAMNRIDYILSVSFVNDKPVFYEDTSGDILLTDDGGEDRRDTDEQLQAMTGNDVLILNADMAKRLGMSKGTVDTKEQLWASLGLAPDASVTSGESKTILQTWMTNVRDAEKKIRKFLQEYKKLEVEASDEPGQRKLQREKQIAALKEMVTLIKKYEESLDPAEIAESPEGLRFRFEIQIEQIKQEQKKDGKK